MRNSGDVIVSNRKGQFALGFVVSAICVIHVACVVLLAGMTSSTAAQIPSAAVSCRTTSGPSAQAPNASKAAIIEIRCSSATPYNFSVDAQPAAGASVVVRNLSGRDASANYLLYFDREPANTENNTVRVTVTY